MVVIACQCGRSFKVPAAQASKGGECPQCHRPIRIIATHLDPQADDAAACLVCTAGPHHVGRQFFLAGDGPILVGKSSERNLQLNDPMVSRLHCQFVRSGQGWRIEDQGSTNGVEINGKRVPAAELKHGDEVVIGDCVFTYLAPPNPAQAQATEVTPPAAPVPAGNIDTPKPEDADDPLAESEDDGLLALAKDDPAAPAVQPPATVPIRPPYAISHPSHPSHPSHSPPATVPARPPSALDPKPPAVAAGPTCPSCKQRLPLGALICVNCGINLKTGRSILTSLETGLDETYVRAEAITRWVSWIIWYGVFPVASEAFGTRKPYAIWAIAALTVLASVAFLCVLYSESPAFDSWQNLLLWSGKFDASRLPAEHRPPGVRTDLVRPDDVGLGAHHPYQLVTNAFLHAGLLHLIGNMIFLLVFGSRVNALIGNILTVAIYPLLAVFASLFHLAAMANQPYHPMLGASGAVMGLAGMYFVFFPLHKVHVLAWWRLGVLFRFRLSLKIFAIRGFWVVLFYIGLDVLYTVLRVKDNVAHWAHLGGFITGMVIAIGLMMTRLVNARGADLLTSIFGQHAWGIVGRPNRGELTADA